MNFCPNCGSALTGMDKFCGKCGASVIETDAGNDSVEAKRQITAAPSASFAEEHDSSVEQNGMKPPTSGPTALEDQPEGTAKNHSRSKKTIAGAIILLVVVVGCLAFQQLSRGAPSYDKICRMNDDLKQARQLGLSSQEKCAQRLGAAILKTTDESLLAKLLANVAFEERFANAILDKIQSPEELENIARMLKQELLVKNDVEADQGSTSLLDAVLDRLPDDAAVERVVLARIGAISGESGQQSSVHGNGSLGKGFLVASLCRRVASMNDGERAERLMAKIIASGGFRGLPPDKRLGIALRTKNAAIRQATGVDQEYLELGDLVAKWDPDCLSRSVREILNRGREIQHALGYVEIVKKFDQDFRSNNIDKWVEYAKSATPILEAINHLSANAGANSPDSDRRKRLVEKRDKAQKTLDELKKMIDEVRTAIDKNDFATVMAACEYTGVRFYASDPDGTGYRLGNAIRERYQQAQNEIQTTEREISALDRAASSQRVKTNDEIVRLKSKLEQIRQRYETSESRKAREEREAERASKILPELIANMVPIPGKNFKMGKTEVTQAQWEAVMGENPSRFKGADNPVEFVSWDDCQAFLKKLNALPAVKESGLTFRLPTDEEWEYACRAGATGDYCRLADGTEITADTLGQVAWFKDNSDETTHPVGQKEPNAFGLYDMHGNVWEWTESADGEFRVDRGGSWFLPAGYCESSFRCWDSPGGRGDGLGFRLCASGKAD